LTISDQNLNISSISQTQFMMGYQHIGVPSATWNSICNTIAAIYASNQTVQCSTAVNSLPVGVGQCADFATSWNLTVQLGVAANSSAYFVLSSESLMQEVFDGTNYQCIWHIQNTGSQNTVLLGESFLQ
jgi:low affinity Fe/Cu permease